MSPAAQPSLDPAIFVIFGITGDLAQRKLLPALYHLLKDNLLHEHTEIIGVSRRPLTANELLDSIELCVLETDNICDPVVLEKFRARLRMVRLDPVKGDDYVALHRTLDAIEEQHGMCMNRLYYLSIPPQVYEPVIRNFGEHHLHDGCRHRTAVSRLLVEKPFGYDLPSAQELIRSTARYFSEEQVFRIDHYLAKETVQNILVFRRQNPLFADSWDAAHISGIDLLLSEQIGVEGRSEFYDNVGALRDVVQNHLMQLLTLVTMELPRGDTLDSAALHHTKETLLGHVRPIEPHTGMVVRAQYDGYRQEVGNPGSVTETFVRLGLGIDTPRWRGVPVTITTGKALEAKRTAITITFAGEDGEPANRLTFRIQPNEGIDIDLTVKRPGFAGKTERVRMDFSYRGVFTEPEHPDAYERVLVDAVHGDHSLFATSAEILAAWRILQPVLDGWQQSDADLLRYPQGSAGPAVQAHVG
ncbi:MAG TPA: glucose-6-phosphate dehydrogenase [Candidatus Saccharimonadales bacterium]|nr:glucose-6-phosphate dehydrogenase [Candidatus Saccharimonadales bacterium]